MGLSSKQVSGDHLELNWSPTMLGSDSLELPTPRPTKRQFQTPQSDPLKCPRCESTNTKFCYYNNYNKMQPRHFCKACKRHWTKGGTLRNVPVGGGRKNKRLKRPNTTATASATTLNPNMGHNLYPLGFSDHKDFLSKASLYKPIGNEGSNVLESYADLEELKGQVSWDFNGNFTGCAPHQSLGFSIVETNPNPNPITSNSFPPLTAYNEDSTITTTRMVMPSSSSSQPWQVQAPGTSNFLESNYWNWNDIDPMVLADLNKPFEGPRFKP